MAIDWDYERSRCWLPRKDDAVADPASRPPLSLDIRGRELADWLMKEQRQADAATVRDLLAAQPLPAPPSGLEIVAGEHSASTMPPPPDGYVWVKVTNMTGGFKSSSWYLQPIQASAPAESPLLVALVRSVQEAYEDLPTSEPDEGQFDRWQRAFNALLAYPLPAAVPAPEGPRRQHCPGHAQMCAWPTCGCPRTPEAARRERPTKG